MKNIIFLKSDASPLHSSKAQIIWQQLTIELSKTYKLHSDIANIDSKTVALIAFNHQSFFPIKTLLSLKEKYSFKMIRIVTESPAVNWQYGKKVNSVYDLSILTHIPPTTLDFPHLINRPPLRGDPVGRSQLSKKFLLKSRLTNSCLIASNYFSFSRIEAYSVRRELINELYNSGVQFDIIGKNWPLNAWDLIQQILIQIFKGKLSLNCFSKQAIDVIRLLNHQNVNYLGFQNKDINLILENYRFGFVVENYLNYVSEKFFNIALSGTIPIIVGNRNSYSIFPENCFFPLDLDSPLGTQYLSIADQKELINRIEINIIDYFTDKNNLNYTYNYEAQKIAIKIINFLC